MSAPSASASAPDASDAFNVSASAPVALPALLVPHRFCFRVRLSASASASADAAASAAASAALACQHSTRSRAQPVARGLDEAARLAAEHRVDAPRWPCVHCARCAAHARAAAPRPLPGRGRAQ